MFMKRLKSGKQKDYFRDKNDVNILIPKKLVFGLTFWGHSIILT